jgi:hypothetical protein
MRSSVRDYSYGLIDILLCILEDEGDFERRQDIRGKGTLGEDTFSVRSTWCFLTFTLNYFPFGFYLENVFFHEKDD